MVTTRTLTVKQTNIDPAFQNAKASECTLSILLTQDGLSFLVKQSKTQQLYMAGFTPLAECSEDPVGDLLGSFPEQPAVVRVVVDVPLATMLPTALSSADQGWAKPVLGATPNAKFASEALGMEIYAVAEGRMEKAIRLSQSDAQHVWLAQMEKLTPGEGLRMWANLQGTSVNLWAHDGKQWALATQLGCVSEEEFLYHLSNVCEQLGWDRKEVEVEVSGWKAATYKEFITAYFGTAKLFAAMDLIKVSSAFGNWDAVANATLIRL